MLVSILKVYFLTYIYMIKSKTYSDNLMLKNIKNSIKKVSTFTDFSNLILNGSQKILSFGEYSQKLSGNKNKRIKVIKYNYKSKL